MGIDIHGIRLLNLAKQAGASLDRTITIGRLDALISVDELRKIEPAAAVESDRFCEPILKAMGAETVDSMDASAFEGATVVHDLNAPLPEMLEKKYTLVFDGGTLEHVFNFPEALRSCMKLLEIGGHLLMTLPANNHMGHGFYQFSPELFFRAFSEENGFEMVGLYLVPTYVEGQWYKANDPAKLKRRVGHNTGIDELSLFLIAKRVADVPIFATPPQQNDYSVEWDGDRSHDDNRLAFFDRKKRTNGSRIKRLIPGPVLALRRTIWAGKVTQRRPDPEHFEAFDPR